MPHEEGLWFIREGVERDAALGRWELWFRSVHDRERRHGTFQREAQAQEVAHRLNELSRHLPATDAQGDGDPRPAEQVDA
jgi:hypothetical protein